MAYDTTSYTSPFWAKSADFVRGRDPLGIQNSSIAVYSLLLPGMTNLTLRMRYYGFYLWLLDQYHHLPPNSPFKQDLTGQYNFIRRAELILSYIMVNKFPDEQSVIGSDFATKNIALKQGQSYYNIALGADKFKDTKKGSVYWDFKSGALGQYYVGSLMGLQLVQESGGYFKRTEKGITLAQAYGQSLSSQTVTLLLKCITTGKLYLSDLDNLTELSLNKDIIQSDEGKLYLQLLLDNDGTSKRNTSGAIPQQRKETLQLFLEFLQEFQESNSWRNFPLALYSSFLIQNGKIEKEAELGWYYYYLNELVHFSMETIFWGMLSEMEKETYSLTDFMKYIAHSVTTYEYEIFTDIEKLTVAEALEKLKTIKENAIEYIDDINSNVKNRETIEGIINALFFLLKLYNDNLPNFEALERYAGQYSLFDKNGNALAVFQKHVQNNLQIPFADFVKNIVQTIINEHTAIAYRKMGNGEKNLLKFLLEDNYLVHIETMSPNFTSPRLKTLYNFAIDLGLITKEGKVTRSGEVVINESA